jgi:queuine tRNA-ribosyltransferase
VVKAKEIIAGMLITWHNLVHYQRLMADLRAAIADGTLSEFLRSPFLAASCDDTS